MILQHQDKNIGPGHYKELGDNKLLITKVFLTIQGEGPFAGYPAIFIRLAGCNRGAKLDMGCGFCDTAFYFDKGEAFSIDRLAEVVGSAPPTFRLVVITGGEPMIQNNLSPLCERLMRMGKWVQIESNGDRLAVGFPSGPVLVVSPKVTRGSYRPIADEVWARADALKFVVSGDTNSPYYLLPNYVQERDGSVAETVFVSPLTEYLVPHKAGEPVSAWDPGLVDVTKTRRNYQRAVELAMRYGYHVSIQQHLFYEVE